MTSMKWSLKADKVILLAKDGKRLDGRALDEYRPIRVERNVSENADGSARVFIGDTQVVAGTKMVTLQPFPDKPDEGSFAFGVEMLPMASEEFETGPPDEVSIELARVVDRGIRGSHCVDFTKWSIESGKLAWTAYVDLYTLDMDGNLFDACAIAAMVALKETRMPKLDDENKILYKDYAGKISVIKAPVLCTFVKVGGVMMVDPTQVEENASTARFSVSVTEDNLLCAFQKGGSGVLTLPEINWCIDIALKRAKEIRKLY